MLGMTGHKLVLKGTDSMVSAPQNLIDVHFPRKTHVTSHMMTDLLGRPVYPKDTKI